MDLAGLLVLPLALLVGALYCGWNAWSFFRDLQAGKHVLEPRTFRGSSRAHLLAERLNAALVVGAALAFVAVTAAVAFKTISANPAFHQWFRRADGSGAPEVAINTQYRKLPGKPVYLFYDGTRPRSPVVGVEFIGPLLTDDDLAGFVREHPDLEWIRMFRTRFSPQALRSLRELGHLAELTLSDAKITGTGLASVLASVKLRTLGIVRVHLSDQAIEAIAHQSQLETLTLVETPLGPGQLDRLLALTQLQDLILTDTGLSQQEVDRIRRALPNCQVSVW